MLGRVTVVGCGLIGGSIVKGLKARGQAKHLAAIDRDDVLGAAQSFVDETAAIGSREASDVLGRSDLVVMASPVGAIVESLSWVLEAIPEWGVVTDTGSVKGAIIEAVRGLGRARRMVPGHPMAGREIGGFEASSAALFEGARWFIAAAADDDVAVFDVDVDAVERVIALAKVLGATPTSIGANAHDRAMAYVSHVPHLVASAVFEAAARAGALGEAGPGFRDTTRIAGGPASVWSDIFRANQAAIARALGEMIAPLIAVRDKLARGDSDAVESAIELLNQARRSKNAAPMPPPLPPRNGQR
jgi:prephenate dehydrogenase